jgi:hypothetical protein
MSSSIHILSIICIVNLCEEIQFFNAEIRKIICLWRIRWEIVGCKGRYSYTDFHVDRHMYHCGPSPFLSTSVDPRQLPWIKNNYEIAKSVYLTFGSHLNQFYEFHDEKQQLKVYWQKNPQIRERMIVVKEPCNSYYELSRFRKVVHTNFCVLAFQLLTVYLQAWIWELELE